MRKQRKKPHEDHVDESWLLPYSDMMTLLLALFIVMFAFSTVDEKKYTAMMESMYTAFGGNFETGSPIELDQVVGDLPAVTPEPLKEGTSFSDLYAALMKAVNESGYRDKIEVVDGDNAITVRFNESVLFLPNSATMTAEGSDALRIIGDILMDLRQLIGHIQIEGHTAFIGEEADKTMAAWQLSSDRAIVVLEYLTKQVGYQQSKLNTAGYSHFVPVDISDTEAGRARNRRVELLITPEAAYAVDVAEAVTQAASPPGESSAASEEGEESSP